MRVTVTLPGGLVEDLDFAASRLRVTRSGIVAALLADTVPAVRQLAAAYPERIEDATEADIKRFRGASAEIISKLLTDALLGEV